MKLLSLFFITAFYSSGNKVEGADFNVVAFSTAVNDVGHISFVNEANVWFPRIANDYNFTFVSTTNWNNLNDDYLRNVQVVLFLDTRPENWNQRNALERYMRNGGAWLGFHFSAFALTPSVYPQDWDWYHNDFIGAGEYEGNTWKPTPAIVRTENRNHGATRNLPRTFVASTNEWYKWQGNLVNNPNIDILLAIDESSFPLGTGPNPWEIWYSGYYPVVWTNRNYRMIYMNMGHNDIDYANGNRPLSSTFESETQNRLIIDSILWLAGKIN